MTGDKWCIYPSYDYAHGQSDAIEGITHSLCTLEFEDHRPLYEWFLENLPVPSRPRQIEFARLNLTYTVLSKRFLLRLVNERRVRGWDDPRMPTISGLRRRGVPPEALRQFAETIGVAKRASVNEYAALEHEVRDVLNRTSPRRMAVLRPLRVVLTNYPEGQVEEVELDINPEDKAAGKRKVPFARELWIERDDFMEDPPKKFFRLAPGREVRLRAAYFITCQEVVKDAAGQVTSCAVRTIRRRVAGAHPTAAPPRPLCTGSPPRTRSRPRCASTITSSRSPTRARAAICSPTSTRIRKRSSPGRGSSRAWPRSPRGRACSSSGWATSARTRTRPPRSRSSTAR
jgi:glutamyl/glutaminyl-tRNA synthetase